MNYDCSFVTNHAIQLTLGATLIVKIGEVRLSGVMGWVGFEILKKPNFIINIRYEILTFSSVGPFFEEGGGGLENFGQKLKFLGFFQLRSPLSTSRNSNNVFSNQKTPILWVKVLF